MAVAIFAAATLGVCASGRCRGLGAGRRRALTIHEPRAPIGRGRGGARQGPPPRFRPAAVARRRCGASPEGIRVGDGACRRLAMRKLLLWLPQRSELWQCPIERSTTVPARVPAPSFTFRLIPAALPALLFESGLWPGREPARAACGFSKVAAWSSRKEIPPHTHALVNIDALCCYLVPRGVPTLDLRVLTRTS